MKAPAGCCDDFDHERKMAMTTYLVHAAFREALQGRTKGEIAATVMSVASTVAIELLVARGMSKDRARATVRRALDEKSGSSKDI